MLDRHARGEDTTDAFAEFMRRHGGFFPERPETVEELIDVLALRTAAGEQLMRSLSPQQRAELSELSGLLESALGTDLAAELAALDGHLRALRPELGWQRRERVRGEEPLGYGEVTGASRPWEYGDEQLLDVVRTVARAVRRSGPRVPVALAVEDFEVVETERRASAAVALCVDLSFSMISEGRWGR